MPAQKSHHSIINILIFVAYFFIFATSRFIVLVEEVCFGIFHDQFVGEKSLVVWNARMSDTFQLCCVVDTGFKVSGQQLKLAFLAIHLRLLNGAGCLH